MKLEASPIQFGTDGWRGLLGVDVTIERLLLVALAATEEMIYRGNCDLAKKVIIGYDRRFLAPEFAEGIASSVRACGLEPLLADEAVTTPACSWAVVEHNALGALIITASHNPPEWLGLKIKSPSGASVDEDFTRAVERRILFKGKSIFEVQEIQKINCRKNHLIGLQGKFNIPALVQGMQNMGLHLIVDSMHGSAAGCFKELLGRNSEEFLTEIRINRDPLFGGNAPEPLEKNLGELIANTKKSSKVGQPSLGLAFDGDGDRIAVIDETGRFCSTQVLIPLFIEHLVQVRNIPGCVIKTVSGSDCIRLIAEKFDRKVIECPVGFKYIAKEMLHTKVLIGGEESGGIGFGEHLPERDALFAALLLLEAIVQGREPLGVRLNNLARHIGSSAYDRIDLLLANNESRVRVEESLKNDPPLLIRTKTVKQVISIDGCKLKFGERDWLMFRFSGTEPLLRIYCEAPTSEEVQRTLAWAKEFVASI